MTAIHVFGVFFLIGVNGFFAATEFSLVAVRLSRVRQLVEKGDPRAKIVEQLIGDLGRVVSGVQVGLTVASLSLGYLGEITLATILRPLVEHMTRPWAPIVAHAVAIVLVFGLLTFLQVVFGEFVPKSLSLARAERVALLVARPFHWFLQHVQLGDRSARWHRRKNRSRARGCRSPQPHAGPLGRGTPGDDPAGCATAASSLRPRCDSFKTRWICARCRCAKSWCRARTCTLCPLMPRLEDAMSMFATTQRSRLPVYEGSLDHILGFVHIKDVIWLLLDRARPRRRAIARLVISSEKSRCARS